jgi:hypothetical protein
MMFTLWAASILGAALFFAGGLLVGRGRRAPAAAKVPVTVADVITPAPALTHARDPEVATLRVRLEATKAAEAREHAALEQATHDLAAARAQVERLRIDLMRAQKQSTDLQSEHKASSVELGAARSQLEKLRDELASARAARLAGRAPLTVRAAGHKAGDVLQALVDGVGGAADVRCAVVADDLGLVVASRGELGDEVAAVGALFGRAGLQAQSVLPLHKVRRVTVEDDQNVTLTLRPLETDESVEGDLALITLAVGAAGERPEGRGRPARPELQRRT